MTTRKKHGHGGLKFLAFVVLVGIAITVIVVGSKSEFGQRITGNREDRRLERTSLTPRFGYAAAELRITTGAIFNVEGSMVDATTTVEVSIDRQSQRASKEVTLARTSAEVAPGLEALPFGGFTAARSEIVTNDYRYVSEAEDQPWTRHKVEPFYYGTALDPHYIPMIDDLMGFELRTMPSKARTVEPVAGFKPMTRPAVDTPSTQSEVTTTYSYEMDMNTFRRTLPILAGRSELRAPTDAPVTVTIGFDDVGLLRFADIAIADSIAKTLAQELGPFSSATYRYTIDVTDIAGEPIDIQIPTNVVDEPDDTVPVPTP